MRMTSVAIRHAKGATPLVMLTAYDTPTARIADGAGADIILVGDSLAMVVLGQPDTLGVDVAVMAHHVAAVSRANALALVVADMPWLSYHTSAGEAVANAGILIRAGAEAVKVEGATPARLEVIAALLDAQIPVMGHIGLTPQSRHVMGGYSVQGRGHDEAKLVIAAAVALDQAGCFALVVECTPRCLTAAITDSVAIPVIGIGAGGDCDGQVLVLHDLLGLTEGPAPRFVRRYANLKVDAVAAAARFADDVRARRYPSEEESYGEAPAPTASPEEYQQDPAANRDR